MNELLAIVLIVLLCCAMFFAWLFALATCPDRLVSLISGTKSRSNLSSSPISRASEDFGARKGSSAGDSEGGGCGDRTQSQLQPQSLLVAVIRRASPASQRDSRPLLGRSRSIPANRNGLLGNASQPQQQLQACSAVGGAPLSAEKRANSKKLSVVPEADEQLTVTSISQCGVRTPASPKAQENGLVVRTVMLTRHHSDCGTKRVVEEDEEEEEEEAEEGEGEEDGREAEGEALPPDETAARGGLSAEAQSQLYNDGPTESFEEADDVPLQPATRRSAPPAIHIV